MRVLKRPSDLMHDSPDLTKRDARTNKERDELDFHQVCEADGELSVDTTELVFDQRGLFTLVPVDPDADHFLGRLNEVGRLGDCEDPRF